MQPTESRIPIATMVAWGASALLAVVDLFFGIATNYLGLLICIISMMTLFFPYRSTPLGAILIFVGATLYFTPLLALIFVQLDPLNAAFFALYNLAGAALCYFTIRSDGSDKGARAVAQPLRSGPLDSILVPFWLAIGLVGTTLGQVGSVIFFGAWAMSLVHMERLMRTRPNPVAGWIAGFFILLFILIFALFIWDGYGRLVLMSMALGPVFLATRYTRLGIPSYTLAGLGVGLVFFGRVLRFGAGDGIAGLSEDSGASHLIVSSELWQVPSLTQWVTSFWEQYLLLFMSWVPREYWQNKPLGVNYTFVDAYLGRDGLSEEHSTAIGLFGEMIFYSPSFWPLLVIFLLFTIVLVRRGVAYMSGASSVGPMLFDLWLITLFWGGMASFGARVWFGLLPGLAYLYLLRALERPRTHRRPNAQVYLPDQSVRPITGSEG